MRTILTRIGEEGVFIVLANFERRMEGWRVENLVTLHGSHADSEMLDSVTVNFGQLFRSITSRP